MALRLDPWASDYDTAVQTVPEDGVASVDITVESDRWAAIVPGDLPRPDAMAFVDGRQRVEARVLDEDPASASFTYGLFGSYGVGAAVVCPGRAYVSEERIGRRLVLGAGRCRRATVPAGNIDLAFEAHAEAENTPVSPLLGLGNVRRDQEIQLGLDLVQSFPLVILDGRLSFAAETPARVIGLVKTVHRMYLAPAQATVLWRLERGERTPVFAILEGDFHRYSWYVRLNPRSVFHHGLAGIARLETPVAAGLEEAVRLADLTARHLPALATTAAWDPRAPQNLYPVSALEAALGHLMGEGEWIRRAIETYLARGGGE